MTQSRKTTVKNTSTHILGVGLISLALLTFIVFGVWLAARNNVWESGSAADAIIFIDVPGRIAIDGNLQVTGPAPVPVSSGTHSLTFFDAGTQEPVEVTLEQGQFAYISNPAATRSYLVNQTRGAVYASAFPPDTTIEISDCTPTDATRPITCKSTHTLSASLSPGTYTIRYSNPHLGSYEEIVSVTANAVTRQQHTFITTVAEWDQWRREHGDIIERNYPRYYRRHGVGRAILLPFEATGSLLGDLFD